MIRKSPGFDGADRIGDSQWSVAGSDDLRWRGDKVGWWGADYILDIHSTGCGHGTEEKKEFVLVVVVVVVVVIII